jgi:hypothetical protein
MRALSKSEYNELMHWYRAQMAKYSPSQARDEHGKWTSDGGGQADPVRLRRGAVAAAVHSVAAAAALSSGLKHVSGMANVQTMRDMNLFDVAEHAATLSAHMRELQHHSAAARAGAHDVASELRPHLAQLKDHLANVKDHIARIKAEATGNEERAQHLRQRIRLRQRAIELRWAERPERRKRPSRWSSAFNVLGFAGRGLAS